MKIRRWQIAAVVVLAAAVVTAMAALSWRTLREERAAQVKAHSIFAFTDQFGQPAAGYRVRLCTMRVAWWSWLFPWRPYGFEQRDVTADERGEVHVTGRHCRLWLKELDRQHYVAPLHWNAISPAGKRMNWGDIQRAFEGRFVYGVLRRQEGPAPVSVWIGSQRVKVKVRGCGADPGTTGFLPLVPEGSKQEDGRLRVEAEAVAAVGRAPGPRAYRGWRVRVVGEGAQLLREQPEQLAVFAPESGYADHFEIDGATLEQPDTFVRTKHYWWFVRIEIIYRPDDCTIVVHPRWLQTNLNGSNDLFDRRWSENFWPSVPTWMRHPPV